MAFCKEMIADISKIDFLKLREIEIPIYFFHGRYDKVCNVDLMEQFFCKLEAPLGKKLIWLDSSAHFFYSDDARKVEKVIVESISV